MCAQYICLQQLTIGDWRLGNITSGQSFEVTRLRVVVSLRPFSFCCSSWLARNRVPAAPTHSGYMCRHRTLRFPTPNNLFTMDARRSSQILTTSLLQLTKRQNIIYDSANSRIQVCYTIPFHYLQTRKNTPHPNTPTHRPHHTTQLQIPSIMTTHPKYPHPSHPKPTYTPAHAPKQPPPNPPS